MTGGQPVPSSASPERIVWRRLDDGDYRKFAAESNDASTGGGARDLRFRNWDAFEPIMERMFPGRKPNSGPRKVEVLTGSLCWDAGGITRRSEASVWPPTKARPNEGRLATVYLYPPFRDAKRFPGQVELVVLVQDSDHEVWPYVIGHRELDSWDDSISRPILDCLFRADRSDSTFAAGFIDLVNGLRECVV